MARRLLAYAPVRQCVLILFVALRQVSAAECQAVIQTLAADAAHLWGANSNATHYGCRIGIRTAHVESRAIWTTTALNDYLTLS